jgi:adenylate cyclase
VSQGGTPELDAQTMIYAKELARLQTLRRTYERLLPTRLDPAARELPAPEVRVATVLFTDIRGFSALAERFADDPAGLLAVVNEHLVVAVRAITRCGGVVEKFVGDGVMATFGARGEIGNHRKFALAAGLAVVGANEALNHRRAAAWGFRLEVGVGAAAGKLVVGGIGSPERSELGVLGDPVNVASRLVTDARPGEILLADSVYHELAESVRADLLSRAPVRGRDGDVEIYRISLLRPPKSEAVLAAG